MKWLKAVYRLMLYRDGFVSLASLNGFKALMMAWEGETGLCGLACMGMIVATLTAVYVVPYDDITP